MSPASQQALQPALRSIARSTVRPLVGPVVLLAALVPTACGSAPRWQLADPGEPSVEQRAVLAAAERRYRAGEDFPDLRAQIVADPVTSWWFTRMLVRDVVAQREGRITASDSQKARSDHVPGVLAREGVERTDPEPLLRATLGQRNPIEERAFAEFERLGAAAVPGLLVDLAENPQYFNRQIGVDLLAHIGPPALPLVERELLASTVPLRRRTAAGIYGAMLPEPAAEAALRRLAGDPDYGVRAAAYRGLAGAEDATLLLCRATVDDADAFARRAAAAALGAHRSSASAEALVAYLQRCQEERDERGCDAAQEALQQLAGTRGPRSASAWRSWAGSWDPR